MIHRIPKRWLLVLLIAVGQVLVLLTASIWMVNWLNVSVQDMMPQPADATARDAQQQAVQNFTGRVHMITTTLTIIVVLFSTLLTAAIVRRYENRLASINQNLEEIIEVRSRALLKSRSAVIFGLAKLAESRDDQTGHHLERIRNYVLILAKELSKTHPEVDEDFAETLGETSSLHDIGKVGIPDSILLSPNKLTDEQRTIIRKHPLIGGDTLLAIKKVWGNDPFLITACEVAFAHHERWDGKGYPFGLAETDIPLAARIVALADVYDALTTERVYKKAMPHEQAREIILAGAASHFDPKVVEAFTARDAEFQKVLMDQNGQHGSLEGPTLHPLARQ